jgi:hypothetical protein
MAFSSSVFAFSGKSGNANPKDCNSFMAAVN